MNMPKGSDVKHGEGLIAACEYLVKTTRERIVAKGKTVNEENVKAFHFDNLDEAFDFLMQVYENWIRYSSMLALGHVLGIDTSALAEHASSFKGQTETSSQADGWDGVTEATSEVAA